MSATARRLETIDALKARADIADIVSRYVHLKRRGHEAWGLCPFHSEKSPSFKADQRRQRFQCFGCDAGGDVLDFLAAVEGLDGIGALKRLRELLGDATAPASPSVREQTGEPDPESERNRDLAQEIWRQAGSVPLGGAVYTYLVERRRISRWDPDRLRWHPECPWGGTTAGCIIAPVNAAVGGLVVGVWRVRPALTGEVQRRGLGPTKGNCSRIIQADGPLLAVTEGVEDALAYYELSGVPTWAALSAGNMANLVLPARFTEVRVVADVDPSGIGLEKGAELVRRLRAEGREARLFKPLHHKDANDVLRARRPSV
jgi:hypothetical protein